MPKIQVQRAQKNLSEKAKVFTRALQRLNVRAVSFIPRHVNVIIMLTHQLNMKITTEKGLTEESSLKMRRPNARRPKLALRLSPRVPWPLLPSQP